MKYGRIVLAVVLAPILAANLMLVMSKFQQSPTLDEDQPIQDLQERTSQEALNI